MEDEYVKLYKRKQNAGTLPQIVNIRKYKLKQFKKYTTLQI